MGTNLIRGSSLQILSTAGICFDYAVGLKFRSVGAFKAAGPRCLWAQATTKDAPGDILPARVHLGWFRAGLLGVLTSLGLGPKAQGYIGSGHVSPNDACAYKQMITW